VESAIPLWDELEHSLVSMQSGVCSPGCLYILIVMLPECEIGIDAVSQPPYCAFVELHEGFFYLDFEFEYPPGMLFVVPSV